QLRPLIAPEGRDFLHYGATTQDIVDTALVLALRDALNLLEADLRGSIATLATLADTHRHTVMAGRTHSQQALPITFGLKAAGWLAPLTRHLTRLANLRPRVLTVQFGGAAGTLAALNGDGLRVASALAAGLGLGEPLTPWHTQRDGLGELASWLSLVTGSLGKLAQDVILLAQSEVGEVRESAEKRGGSSTMPQKQNPILSEGVIAAARLNATLLGAVHQAALQEHERGTHGWQLEWLTLPQMIGLTGGALARVRQLATELDVDEARMARNVIESRGLMLAEAYTFALTPTLGREAAKNRVRDAVQQTVQLGQTLAAALEPLPAGVTLPAEADYLGDTQSIIDRVLRAAGHKLRSTEP
ncbi:adenylosuccinate lyase family protein, partial [Deinococcus sp.]|uniref:class-II fumarase/aspartase family protein n=1 Tax=Deinococcus sp. TaxID=47478 RepID=UPI002869987F